MAIYSPDKLAGESILLPGATRPPVDNAFKRPLLLACCGGLLEPNPNPPPAPNPTFCNRPELRSWPISPFELPRGGKSSALLGCEDWPTAFWAPNLNPPELFDNWVDELKSSSCCCCCCAACCADNPADCCKRIFAGPILRAPAAPHVDWLCCGWFPDSEGNSLNDVSKINCQAL